ncbi:MAG: hypothetical protein LBQ50_10160, partial [Planctomycetaceae bacterium]|nr:hypothetical protein [Planctomycetaceae bacterium]
MTFNEHLNRAKYLESRLQELLDENLALRTENAALQTENASLKARVRELEETLRVHADAASSKPPKVTLNYSSQRNDLVPKSPNRKRRRKKSQKKAGRKPKEAKTNQTDQTIKIYPKGISRRKCVLRHTQFVWRLIDKRAQYVCYLI